MKFTKLSGLGNDFILFDNREGQFTGDERDFFRQICQRRVSIGADGVILLEKSKAANFKYRHYNADGSYAEMCGNGARSVCYYAFLNQIAPSHLTFEINNTINEAWIEDDQVRLKLPPPEEIMTSLDIVKESELEEGGFVRVGVPHLVIFVDEINQLDVFQIGRHYRNHPFFKDGANVNFVKIIDANTIKIRTYERGVENETLACGTGSVAAAIIYHATQKAEPPIIVKNTGGDLIVNWDESFNPLFLQGKVKIVYYGELET